jgi:membrane protein implicated in regulation of membrane protease activity
MTTQKKAQSARTLLWFSGALIVIGLAVLSPAGMLACMAVAALAALAALLLGSGSLRIVAAVLIAAALGFGASVYPKFEAEQQRYLKR